MYHEFAKNVRIMSDLMFFCNKLGINDFEVELHLRDKACHCHIRCPIPSLSRTVLDELTQALNRPRQKEIEQSFWGLSGEDDIEAEITLVGMMIDKATIEYGDGMLDIHCMRIVD